MPVIGHGADICTSTTRPASPSIGAIIYQTDTDEYLKYVNYGGTNRWMQADVKSGRNVIINGGFDVWQRGTSVTGFGGGYGVDMWREYTDTGSGTQSKDTTVYAGNNRASYKWTTGGSASNWGIFQYIESSNCLHMANKKVTLSFWASTSTSRGLAATISYNTGTDVGWPTSFTTIDTLNFTTSSSLQLFSLTVTIPSNAKTLQVGINSSNGGNFAAGVTVNITGVQLEIGSAPSEFEFEPYETVLRKCQRYYYPIKTSMSNSPVLYRFNYSSYANTYHCIISLPTSPRITNGIYFYDLSGGSYRIHKPGVRWDSYSTCTYESIPGNDTNYQLYVVPSVDDGSSFYGIYLYGVGIYYSGEL